METVYDVLVLGGGPAGYAAALYAARAGRSVLVLERMSAGGQMATTGTIDNYPGFPEGVDGFTLGMQMQAGAERFGAACAFGEVFEVSFSGERKTVKTADAEYTARTVVIATGAAPRELGLAREGELLGRGVHTCAHCDGRFYRDKTVLVVGGGNSAVTDALYLANLAKRVILVHRRDTLRAEKVYRDALAERENVEILWNTTVSAFLGEDALTGVRLLATDTKEERELAVDGVFVSIGRRPATELFRGVLPLDGQGYIVADETTRTALPGVFAAGDVRKKRLRQVVTAVADGACAAVAAEDYLEGV